MRTRLALALAACLLPALVRSAGATSYVVTSTADSGTGTLRDALAKIALDVSAPPHTVTFNLGGTGPWTITLATALPPVTRPTHLDAGSAMISGRPGIRLDGAAVGGVGLELDSGAAGSLVNGLSITGFGSEGIVVLAGSNGDAISNCYIGVAPDGTTGAGNVGGGISVSGDNVVIGHSVLDGNVVSGNGSHGILLAGSGAGVYGNEIGTSADGKTAIPNVGDGIHGSAATGATIGGNPTFPFFFSLQNIVSANGGAGIFVDGNSSGWKILGNVIGADATGSKALGNGTYGIDLFGDSAQIGDTTSSGRNLIAANPLAGVAIESSASGAKVYGNWIGTNAAGTLALGSQPVGVSIGGTGCTIGGTDATYRNLISGNGSYGIAFAAGSSGCVVEGNWIGLDLTGTAALANGSGIGVNGSSHVLGGSTAGTRNVISGNTAVGVWLSGSGNKVQGNYVGTTAAGSGALPNGQNGIRVLGVTTANDTIGGTGAGQGNVVSGNAMTGITVDAGTSAITIQGNLVGLDATGTTAIANGGAGVQLGGTGDQLGGATAAARNVISGNAQDGVDVTGLGHTVQGNYIGTTAAGSAAVANGQNGIRVLGGSGHLIGGGTAGQGNVVSGNTMTGITLDGATSGCTIQGNLVGLVASGGAALGNAGGIAFAGSDHTVGGAGAARNVVSGNPQGGLQILGSGHHVQGNWVGLDAGGTAAVPNGAGVAFYGASGVTFGGTGAGQGNVVAGNGGTGISLDQNTVSCTLLGNRVGTNPAGTAAIPNAGGISVDGTGNVIGGTAAGAGNLVSGNGGDGMGITGADHVVQGNFIGTNAAGTAPLGNLGYGIRADGIAGVTIGGAAAGAGNLISGNGRGLNLGYGCHGNQVLGNVIGLDATMTSKLPNNGSGIELGDCWDNQIGAPGAGNVIAGSPFDGIDIQGATSTGNLVQGNWIGTNQALAAGLGNGLIGVYVNEAMNNVIGGSDASEGNVIANEFYEGVVVERGEGNAITANSIYGSGLLGIDVGDQGAFANDALDADGGGNRAQNYPLLSSVTVIGGAQTSFLGTLQNEPGKSYDVEVFSSPTCGSTGFGEGRTYLGSTVVTTDASGNGTLNLTLPIAVADPYVSATVTDAAGNTSEFSPCAKVGGPSPGKIQLYCPTFLAYAGVLPTADVVLVRSDGMQGTVSVTLVTSDGSAKAGQDYTDSTQVVTFGPGEVLKTVHVPILVDPTPAAVPAVVVLGLTSPTGGATLGLAAGQILVWPLDATNPGAIIDDAAISEGNSGQKMLSFTVHLSPSDHTVSIAYLTEDGTARAGQDYESTTGTLVFPASATAQSQVVQVPIDGDTLPEPDETFYVRLTVAPAGGSWVAFDAIATGTILDDDSAAPNEVLFSDDFETGDTTAWDRRWP